MIQMHGHSSVYSTQQYGFSQAVSFNNLVFVSGVVAWNNQRSLNGKTTFLDQLKSTVSNLELILEASQSSMQNALQFRFYVKDLNRSKQIAISLMLQNCFKTDFKPASTVVGIDELGHPELQIEIEAIASKILS